MAQQDNLLRAPAEGFGQDVSFAFRPERNPPSLDTGRQGVSRGGIVGDPVGGGVQQARPVEAGPANPTLELLSKVAGTALKHALQKKRAEAFVAGMQRAASGEAVTDIAEGQPWYANIFGETDVVEGARAYTSQAKAAEVAAAVEDSMPEVRKLDDAGAKSYFSDLVSKHITGDAATDGAIMQSFARTLPATMRRQAKEHYAWRQEEASNAESRAVMAWADLMQNRARGNDKQTDDEYALDNLMFIASMRPPEGRDMKSWTDARTGNMLALAQAGKFHAVGAMRTAGFLDMLPVESRTKIETALDTAENRTIAGKSFEYADEIGRIAAQATVFSSDLSPEHSRREMQALNERFSKETGIDRDLIGLDKAGGVVKDAWVTMLREGERRISKAAQAAETAREAGDKAGAELALQIGADHAVSIGQAGAAMNSLPDGVVHKQFRRAFDAAAAKGPQAQAQLLMLNYSGAGSGNGYVNPSIKDFYERRVDLAIGARLPADFPALFEAYEALVQQHPALADAYLGKHADRMAVYAGYLTPGPGAPAGSRNDTMADMLSFGAAELPRRKTLSKDEFGAAVKTLEGQHSDNPIWNGLGRTRVPLRPDQSQQAMSRLQPLVEQIMTRPGVSADEAVRLANEKLGIEYGADMIGGFFVPGTRGMKPLSAVLRKRRKGESALGSGDDGDEVWDGAFKATLEEQAELIGADMDDPIVVLRTPDEGDVARLDVYFTAADGRQLKVPISSEDIKRTAGRQHTRARLYKTTPAGFNEPIDYSSVAPQ